ncbi:endonuclease III [Methanoregula formicica]|uniref:Endonuclease III n=1 Tax=Methanoregula formicica (strain DSM 22288 / NBRC 105244 / SMSP) TaxID=593750 RepID=L0HIF9_METFS|nr:endonuclease III [Methanoregula formicica]AGB03093.1 endonuclease III [Methanoregula formicica SMSP]
MRKQDAARIYAALLKRYPDAREPAGKICRGSPFEVIVLTILSAQTTDKAVLKVKPALFSQYPTPAKLAKAKAGDVETIIHSLGYYHAKAKNIIAASQTLIDQFGGSVPETMDELLTIPGVGRKTANIVLYHALGKNEGIAVDTHVRRLAQRIGFSDTDNVEVIERDLMAIFPKKDWGDLTDVLIAHGRVTCDAKKPLCGECVIRGMCRWNRNSS